jgi:hypothetical protein
MTKKEAETIADDILKEIRYGIIEVLLKTEVKSKKEVLEKIAQFIKEAT